MAARVLFERCHGLNDSAHRAIYAALTATDPHALMLGYLAWTLTSLGYMEQARSWINKALTEARLLGHAPTLALVLYITAVVESATGSPHAAQRHAEEMVALSNEHGFPFWSALEMSTLGGHWPRSVKRQKASP